MAIITESFVLNSLHGNREFLCDVRYVKNHKKKPIIVFVHGFKGFKDWGHFNLLADSFANEGFVFLKLNLSHNGTTPEHPLDFADLEAFGSNNYTIELDDIKALLDHLESNKFPVPETEINLTKLYLIGHSRGGGVCIIKASEDKRIKKLVTWASVSKFGTMLSGDQLDEWKTNGVLHIYNSRTKQDMPLYYQLAEDFLNNAERFSIPKSVGRLMIPYLNIHGNNDETVPVSAVSELQAYNKNMISHIVEGGNHVFGATHPFQDDKLPHHAQKMFDATLDFLRT